MIHILLLAMVSSRLLSCLLQPVLLITTFITIITTTTTITALPDGAPVCTVGEPAPQVLHLDPNRNPVSGHLADIGLYIQIGDTILNDTKVVYEFEAHVDLPVVVASRNGFKFKGVLIVLSRVGSDLNGNLFLDGDADLEFLRQSQCDAGRVGVTHNNNNTKTAVRATMNFDENFDVVLVDVNVVIINNFRASFFYWDQYQIRSTGATLYPTPVPVFVCGLFSMNILCLPKITFCGALGRLLGQDQRDCVKKNQFFALSY